MSSPSLALTSTRTRRSISENRHGYGSSHDDDHGRNRPRYVIPVEDGGDMYAPWRLFEERVRTGPYGLTSFPSQPFSPVRVLILSPGTQERVNPRLRQFIRDSPPRIRSDWHLTLPQHETPGLTDSELKRAMNKLRKEVYNPTYPRKKAWTKGFFSTKSSSIKTTESQGPEEEKNEDSSCTICLEAFVPNEKVLVTPCNHMFHNDCLVPWLKSHGKCPVCRSVLYERKERALSLNNNYSSISSEDDSVVNLVSLIRAMEEALNWVNVSH